MNNHYQLLLAPCLVSAVLVENLLGSCHRQENL